jgi:sugar-specific transcriptional regulator TrmB
MKTLNEFLSQIGFNKNEIIIYETLLELGTSSVQEISKKTKIHRTNIYDALNKLVDNGIVYEINEEKKMFSPRPLKSLREFLKYKEAELDNLIKDFEKKISKKEEPYVIKYSKGVFALRSVVESLLEGKSIELYGIPGKAPDIIGPMLKKFHKNRIRKKILMRHIYNATAIDRVKFLNKMKYTEARILPKQYDTSATTIISGDKIAIFLWDKDITVIEMYDKEIAKTYKNYFEILWKKAK